MEFYCEEYVVVSVVQGEVLKSFIMFYFMKCSWEVHYFGLGFVCWVPYMHLETEAGEVVVYGLGSWLYILYILEYEGAIIDIR